MRQPLSNMPTFHFNRRDASFRWNITAACLFCRTGGILVTRGSRNIPFEWMKVKDGHSVVVGLDEDQTTVRMTNIEMIAIEVDNG